MRWRRTAGGCVLALTMTTGAGCGTSEEDMQRDVEQAAAEAREAVNEVAAEVGHDMTVLRDNIVNCIPGDRESGKTLSYSVSVAVRGELRERLRGVASRFQAEGWDTTPRGDGNDLSLVNDVASVLIVPAAEEGRANVIAESRCIT